MPAVPVRFAEVGILLNFLTTSDPERERNAQRRKERPGENHKKEKPETKP
jgi:hypothetical protein